MNKREMIIELEEMLGVYKQLKAESKPNGTIYKSFERKANALKQAIEILETESNTSVSYK